MMRLGTHLECVGSSLRVSGASQDGAREFVRRRPRLAGRLSGVAKRLVGSIKKITRNTLGDHRRRTMRLAARNTEGCWIVGVRSLSLVVMYDLDAGVLKEEDSGVDVGDRTPVGLSPNLPRSSQ
ncbi:hypothetical protein B296_00018448 [Ensete ventricosum]|uniref:Uncharacterized protein n=1 Tax=Ensete ventricosum TaxID=4639 RepID=A0A426XVU9_ENSVE|nr:hypothetical protein B296_00018448 [Ensete ventricosum]